MATNMREDLLASTLMEVLAEHEGVTVPREQILALVAEKIDLNKGERTQRWDGRMRWDVFVHRAARWAQRAGWLAKNPRGWQLTEAGLAAVDEYPPHEILPELKRRRSGRAPAHPARPVTEAELVARLRTLLAGVEAGFWTTIDDLAEAMSTPPEVVERLLVTEDFHEIHRVLDTDGRIHDDEDGWPGLFVIEGLDDHVGELMNEGLGFDGTGRADAGRRLTADLLRRAFDERDGDTAPPRAWLVRGANVEGVDLVDQWLDRGFVSLAASQLSPAVLRPDAPLAAVVAEAYGHKSYSVRDKLAWYFHAFIRLMREGDHVLTVHHGDVHLGVVDGPVYFVEPPDRRSNLRRSVRWITPEQPFDLTDLTGPLPTLIQNQADLIDLTDAVDAIDRLYSELVPDQPAATPEPVAHLAEVPAEVADELLLDRGFLGEVRDLLAERRQLILHGPPGTGKTFLAHRLAEALTEPHAVKLIQFHPSYTYEDFFEGFRPVESEDGTLRFKLTSGPLRELADSARENPSIPYILLIDEINRGNLAKIFGELYFLLEYRDRGIRLQYSRGDFTLPANLYLIGTMNTADRSIALVDAAMRRRFAFVEMHPAKPPVAGLLQRWLDRHELVSDAPELLDALNTRLADADSAIGPSYLMRPEVYDRVDGLDRVWRYDILPLLVENHYADDVDVEQQYGLDALRRSVPVRP